MQSSPTASQFDVHVQRCALDVASELNRSSRNQKTSQRQGPRSLRSRRHAALRRDRSALRVRRDFARSDSEQGRGPESALRLLVQQVRQRSRITLSPTDFDEFPKQLQPFREQLAGRSMIVRKTKPLAVECVVRGYLAGSGWKEYQESQSVCGIKLPAGLQLASQLARTDFHALDQGRDRPRREHRHETMRADSRQRNGRASARISALKFIRAGRDHAANSRESSSPTRNSNSASVGRRTCS